MQPNAAKCSQMQPNTAQYSTIQQKSSNIPAKFSKCKLSVITSDRRTSLGGKAHLFLIETLETLEVQQSWICHTAGSHRSQEKRNKQTWGKEETI
jgi:hypothetical protein